MKTLSGKESHLSSVTKAISGYTDSVQGMSRYVILKNGIFNTRPVIGFFTDSLYPITSLLPGKLPENNLVINVLLLANSNSLFIIEYLHKDNSRIMTIQEFATKISEFGQTLKIVPHDFDQILCLRQGKFDLIAMNSEEIYSVQNTTKISHVYTLFSNIIDKENEILSKLQQFSDMLQSSTLSHHLSKRNLLDILFSSYSIDQIGETSNNFNKMKSFSEKLWHSQNQMAQTIKNLNIDEKKVHYQTLYLEFAQISSNIYELFIYALSQIKKSVKPTRTVNIIFELMTGSQFCELNQCFSAPVFNQINETYLQVTFTKTFQTLKRAIFVSCTIYNDMTVSVYSHSLAFLELYILITKNSAKREYAAPGMWHRAQFFSLEEYVQRRVCFSSLCI